MKEDLIVLVDDDSSNLDLYESYFTAEYSCEKIINPFSFEKALEKNPVLIIIDVFMPLMDGPTLYQKIIDHPKYNGCPVLFISASESDDTLIKALRAGGQGFLCRSMNPEEIRIRARNKIEYFKSNRSTFTLGEVKLDIKNLRVYENEDVVELTLTEMKLLKTLLVNYPNQLTREEMNQLVWPGLVVQSNTLNTHLCNLRAKLSKWSYEIQHIKNQGILLIKRA